MFKLQKNERIGIIMEILSRSPGKIFTLGYFTEMFGTVKSTISEDISIIQGALNKFGLGTIDTAPGASGGVKFTPTISGSRKRELLDWLCIELSKKERVLPGGYIYTLDIIYDPGKISVIGSIFAEKFSTLEADYVITMETKGIPLAFITAMYLNIPLVIVRHFNEATDGASVNINYISGSSNRIQTMVLSLRALKKNSKLLFIDDFMRGGGTAKGIIDLAGQFECEVSGIGVLMETAQPVKKLVDNYFSILTLDNVGNGNTEIHIHPTPFSLLKEMK